MNQVRGASDIVILHGTNKIMYQLVEEVLLYWGKISFSVSKKDFEA